ncbi:hypothetical protein LTS72_23515 [Mycobacterium ostraviense]|nr:hypothetical protein [Mycobacterium ostraviense]UGT94670.1 hypothetical protein LTS72_23515 [Mycobacterium ostraviense]
MGVTSSIRGGTAGAARTTGRARPAGHPSGTVTTGTTMAAGGRLGSG